MLFRKKVFCAVRCDACNKGEKKKSEFEKDTHPSLYAGKIKFRLQIDFDQKIERDLTNESPAYGT